MAKQKSNDDPTSIVVLDFTTPELKQEVIEVFCKKFGFINLKAEGTLSEETTKEDFFKEKVGEYLLLEVANARTREEKAKVSLEAHRSRDMAGERVKESMKGLRIK